MEIVQPYQKKRAEFGRMCNFSDRPATLLADIVPDSGLMADYIRRDPCEVQIQNAFEFSEHEVNTETVTAETRGINHLEGGWPKDVDPNEVEQVLRYRKKVEKDENFVSAFVNLGEVMEHTVRQNNAVDIYEDYYPEGDAARPLPAPEAKSVNVFRDPNEITRPATSISWHPDSGKKLAVAYSVLDFQKAPAGTSLDSYIWDIEKPTAHELALTPSSPLVSLEYNPKDGNILIGGQYNGQIAVWDTRKGSRPCEVSPIEKSHRDPVYKAQYLSTKSGTDAFSCSTDGQVLFWDVRKLSEPIETLLIDPENTGKLWGAVSLEYESTMPTKFQVGTEQGAVVLFNRKAKNPAEKIAATYQGHHGPVYAVERNPFFPKYFMSIGDWTMRIWCEDVKESAVIWSEYHKSYLLTGTWSQARPGVCFTGKHDGSVGIWDLLFKTNQPALTLQVADAPIGCIRPDASGQFLACGSNDGNVTLLSLNETLSHIQPNEKPRVSAVFERETSREKVLASRMREVHLAAKAAERSKSARPASGKSDKAAEGEAAEEDEEVDPIKEAEDMFWEAIANDKAQREKKKAKKEADKAKAEKDAADEADAAATDAAEAAKDAAAASESEAGAGADGADAEAAPEPAPEAAPEAAE